MLRSFLLLVFGIGLTACAADKPSKPDAPAGYGQQVTPAGEPAKGQPRITFAQCHVDGPYIAITFDDGPHDSQTPRLLKMLKERGIKATFFCVGQCVAQNPEIAKQITTEGHEIANHSWSHPLLTNMNEATVRDQIGRTHNVILQTTGVTPTLLRPPYGAFTVRQRAWAHATWGYKTVLWDVDSLDWKHRSPAKTQSIIVSETRQGSIILCHDIHKTTVDAMPGTLDGLLAKGFKFVTATALLNMHREPAVATKGKPAPTATGAEAAGAAVTLEDLQKQPQPAHVAPGSSQGAAPRP
ncbi:MAG: polysaccharide deacetylase family protein [Chthoniobacteraceae bacterium]